METYVAPWPVWVFLGVAFSIIFWWFRLVSSFFKYMASNHVEIYREMGSPTLFSNNTPGNNISFLRFILSNKYADLNDPVLSQKCGFLKRFFYGYMVGFAALVFGVFYLGNS